MKPQYSISDISNNFFFKNGFDGDTMNTGRLKSYCVPVVTSGVGGNVGAKVVFFKTLQDMHWNLFFPPSLTYGFKVKDC